MAVSVHNAPPTPLHDLRSSQPASPSSPTSFSSQQPAYPTVRSHGSPHSSLPGTPTTASNGSSMLDPPPSMSFAGFMQTWSDSHVARWLADYKLGHLANVFKTNDIRGDVLLDLNQATLKEMGITSVGERIRILNAVKALRQKSAQNASAHKLSIYAEHDDHPRSRPTSRESSPTRQANGRRLDASRPAPLQLSSYPSRSDLPRLVRDGQDSARAESSRSESSKASSSSSVRPLPQPHHSVSGSSSSLHTPHSSRPNLPPLPPPPRGQPPLPPTGANARSRSGSGSQTNGRKTPQGDSSPYHPPLSATSHSQGLLTPNAPSGSWTSYGLPADPRPGSRTPVTPNTSMTPSRLRSPLPGSTHGRNTSMSSLNPQTQSPAKLPQRPSTGGQSPHPFTSQHPPSLTPAQQLANLSPIAESFGGTPSSPSPPASITSYRVGPGSFMRPTTPSAAAPTLDDLKRKLVRFQLPEAGQYCTINAEESAGGIEILEKALRKLHVGTKSDASDYVRSDDGGLSVDGWGVYIDWGQNDSGRPLTEAQLVSFCHSSPDDPVRAQPLILRKIPRRSKALNQIFGEMPPPQTPGLVFEDEGQPSPPKFGRSFATDQAELENIKKKKAKRASTISVLSGLGVNIRDPETPLPVDLPPPSPTEMDSANTTRRPSKLRNFFGQRPPSELITNHLADYFPTVEKKVLERTRRQSTLRVNSSMGQGKRDSIISWNPPASSRFSVSTFASHRPPSAMSSRSRTSFSSYRAPYQSHTPGDESPAGEAPPRVSISTDSGSETSIVDESALETPMRSSYSTKRTSTSSTLSLLPPVKFPSESLSDSLTDLTLTGDGASVRSFSSASKRMSLITELRSKRDRSDAASLMTVDEITAEVESRRESGGAELAVVVAGGDPSSADEWTQVAFEKEGVDGDAVSTLEPQEIIPDTVAEETEVEDEEEEDDEDEYEVEDEDEDEEGDGDEAEDELTDDEPNKAITSRQGEKTIKWIKGALIGAGSFGQVYLGMDAATGLLMAVKQVSLPTGTGVNQERKQSMLSALEREIELLKDLQHENIVQYHTSCVDDEHLNIFLEYVPGGSVTALLSNYGAFEEPLVRNFVRQILTGLNYLHERDIIHRDIKGANILVDNKGGIKISDFGISKKVEDNLLRGGSRAHRPSLQGSVFWMAPEVVKQTAYTRKADIWSVGCLVVEMLTGEHPWAQLSQMQAIFKIGSSAKPAIPNDISPEADNFLQLTFELNHEARPDASDLLLHPWILGTKVPNTA